VLTGAEREPANRKQIQQARDSCAIALTCAWKPPTLALASSAAVRGALADSPLLLAAAGPPVAPKHLTSSDSRLVQVWDS